MWELKFFFPKIEHALMSLFKNGRINFFLSIDEDLVIPKASFMQTGLRNVTQIIREKIPFENEGDIFDLEKTSSPSPEIRFLDLFWFFNPIAERQGNGTEKPLDLVTFGLNLNYGNLRINGYENARSALHNQALFITKDLMCINAAIYPTGLFNIRNLNNGERYRPIEQLFVRYNPQQEAWHDELTQSTFQKHDDRIKMTLKRSDEQNYFYIFEKRQYDLFNFALDYVLNNGLSVLGSRK